MTMDAFTIAGQTLANLAKKYGMTHTAAKKAIRLYAIVDGKKVPTLVAWKRADGIRVYVSTDNFRMTDELGRHTEKLTNSCSESVSFNTSVWMNGADEIIRLLPMMFRCSVFSDAYRNNLEEYKTPEETAAAEKTGESNKH